MNGWSLALPVPPTDAPAPNGPAESAINRAVEHTVLDVQDEEVALAGALAADRKPGVASRILIRITIQGITACRAPHAIRQRCSDALFGHQILRFPDPRRSRSNARRATRVAAVRDSYLVTRGASAHHKHPAYPPEGHSAASEGRGGGSEASMTVTSAI